MLSILMPLCLLTSVQSVNRQLLLISWHNKDPTWKVTVWLTFLLSLWSPHFLAPSPLSLSQYKSRNNYLVQIDGFRGYYQQWLKHMPAQSAEEEQGALQSQTDAAELRTEATDGLTEAQRNHRAAARRCHTRNRDRKSSSTSTVWLNSRRSSRPLFYLLLVL